MSITEELKRISGSYAAGKISRRTLVKRAAAFGLSAPWIAALANGALAAPAPVWGERGARAQADKAATFIVAVEGDVDTFDPAFTVNSKTAQTVIQNTFDQLTQYQVATKQTPAGTTYQTVDTEQIIPMLAQTWKAQEADLVFTLRDGLTFANGNPIDAATMLTGYRRIFETKGISSSLLSMGGGVTDTSAFGAPDPRTFVIKMAKPNTLIPKNNVMHNTSALDPKELAAHRTAADPWATDYFKTHLGVGNGPYQLASYKPADELTLVANPRYYGDKPTFATVILKVVPDPIQRVELLKKGDVDFATLVPIKELPALKQDPNLKVLSLPSRLLTMLEMNGKIPPFDKKAVRQAVAYATPYQAIIRQVYQGEAQVAKSIIPAGMPTSDFSTNTYATDPAKAKQLLAAAGYPDGKGLPPIKLSLRIGDEQWEQIAILEQDALRKIGVNVTIEKLAYAAFNEAQQGKKLQFWVDEFLSWVNDPFYQLSWMVVSTSPVNFPSLTTPRLDQLVAQYTLAQPGPQRDAASREAQAIAIDEGNYVFLCQPNWTVYTGKDVAGYVYYNDELPRYARFARTP